MFIYFSETIGMYYFKLRRKYLCIYFKLAENYTQRIVYQIVNLPFTFPY